jgi:hypothetical protein
MSRRFTQAQANALMHTKTRGLPKTPVKAKETKPNRYATFPAYCACYDLPAPVAEHVFHPTRKWRFDFAWPEQKLALEIEGGLWVSGGHSRGSGRIKDHEKFAEAAAHGWRIIPRQPSNILSLETVDLIRRALAWHETL